MPLKQSQPKQTYYFAVYSKPLVFCQTIISIVYDDLSSSINLSLFLFLSLSLSHTHILCQLLSNSHLGFKSVTVNLTPGSCLKDCLSHATLGVRCGELMKRSDENTWLR